MKTNILFIDFSSTCIAFCHKDLVTNKVRFSAMINHYEISKLEKFDILSHKSLLRIKDELMITSFKRKPMSRPKGEQHSYNKQHILNCSELSTNFLSHFTEFMSGIDYGNIIIGWEDYPTSVKSNSSCHLTEYTAFAKSELFKSFPQLVEDSMWYQPQVIKMIAGNGNFTKQQMLLEFCKEKPTCKLHEIIKLWRSDFVVGAKAVSHPVEDLVDAYYGMKTVEKELKTN